MHRLCTSNSTARISSSNLLCWKQNRAWAVLARCQPNRVALSAVNTQKWWHFWVISRSCLKLEMSYLLIFPVACFQGSGDENRESPWWCWFFFFQADVNQHSFLDLCYWWTVFKLGITINQDVLSQCPLLLFVCYNLPEWLDAILNCDITLQSMSDFQRILDGTTTSL